MVAIELIWSVLRVAREFMEETALMAPEICAAVLLGFVVDARGLWQLAQKLAYNVVPSRVVVNSGVGIGVGLGVGIAAGRELAIAWICSIPMEERVFIEETVLIAFWICATVLPGLVVDDRE